MQLIDILPPFSKRSGEEQLELVREIRHIKMVLKPDVKAKKKKTAKKASQKQADGRKKKATSAMKNLSQAELKALIAELGG